MNFTQMGFTTPVTAASANPGVDGYLTTFNGNPYHVHPTATPAQWSALESAITAGSVTVNPYVAPASPTSAQLLTAYQQSAQTALAKADLTAIRIGEAVTLGLNSWTSADVVAWTNYRRTLRSAIATTSVGTLPVRPAYPAGT